MKIVEIVVFDPELQLVLSTQTLDLPSKILQDDQNSYDVAQSLLKEVGCDACAWTKIFSNHQIEIWQPLMVAKAKDVYLEEDLNLRWISLDEVESKCNLNWHTKVCKTNFPKIISSKMTEEFKDRQHIYTFCLPK